MEPEKQDNVEAKPLSPLAKDLTYGERKYSRIFDVYLNFFVNLFASAAFTTWMSHARNPIRIPFTKKELIPYKVQTSWAEALHKLPVMGLFGDKESSARMSVSKTLAGILSLTTAGHFVMIPSVWIGSKFKSQLVEKWDRQHYGDDAMEDSSLKLRHAMIAAEERPTLLGAFLGRVGTVVATQVTGYTVGNATNIPRMIGSKFSPLGFLKNFKGLDYFTELMGSKVGSVMTEAAPDATKKVNSYFARKNFGWSIGQEDVHPELKGMTYGSTTPKGHGGGIPEHFGRNLVADILYTVVTATTISPAINFLKKYIPGITYKPIVSAEQQRILASADKADARPVRPFVIRDEAPESGIPGLDPVHTPNDNFNSVNDNGHAPRTKVSSTKDHATLAEKPALTAAHAG